MLPPVRCKKGVACPAAQYPSSPLCLPCLALVRPPQLPCCCQRVGNTGGLGGAFGLMWALGSPLPAPEGRPWSPSLQLRLLNSGVWLVQVGLGGVCVWGARRGWGV